MIIVSPSVLSADFSDLQSELSVIKSSGAEYVHLDVMDGHFVNNISFGAPIIASLRGKSDLFFDTHLMISHPLKYIKDFAVAGSDMITFHLESDDNPDEVISEIRKQGKKVGISIKPKTDVKKLNPYLDKVDCVLIMTVEPGFGGQSFMKDMMPKIEYLRNIKPLLHISVDGGINAETSVFAKNAGADILVAGSYFFKSNDKSTAVELLKA